jgi:nitrite reductase/ring-hydroxylating ferredoxin subunit
MLAEEVPVADCPPVRVTVLGEHLIAFRDSRGKVGLLDRYCAHRRADLFFGRNEDCGLRCVYHGWKYDVEGACVDMPSEPPESNFKDKIKLKAYPCQERAGLIWAYLGPRELTPEMPQLEWTRVPESHRYMQKSIIDCNYLQTLEGDIDTVHSAFLHRWFDPNYTQSLPASLGGGQGTVSTYRTNFRAKKAGEWAKFATKDTEYGLMIGAYREAGDGQYLWHITHWMMPTYDLVGAGGAGQTLRCNARIPIDDEHLMLFRVQWNPDRPLTTEELACFQSGRFFSELIPGTYYPKRNMGNDFLIDRELQRSWNFTGIMSIPEQDQAVTCSMGPITDRSQEHLGSSDAAIVALRRRLLTAVRDLQEGKGPCAAYNGDVYKVRQADVLLSKDIPFEEGAQEVIPAKA